MSYPAIDRVAWPSSYHLRPSRGLPVSFQGWQAGWGCARLPDRSTAGVYRTRAGSLVAEVRRVNPETGLAWIVVKVSSADDAAACAAWLAAAAPEAGLVAAQRAGLPDPSRIA